VQKVYYFPITNRSNKVLKLHSEQLADLTRRALMVSMTIFLFDQINADLAEWNPIGVPPGLAREEYKRYVPLLLAAYNRGQDVATFLRWVYEQQLGLSVHEEFWVYTSPVATRLTTLLRASQKASL
jgi:hypothetical protein